MIEVLNLTKQKNLDKEFFKVVQNILAKLGIEKADLSIVFVGELKIRKINREYRKKDETTDVLSFSFSEGKNKKEISGEIFVCPRQVLRQAKKIKKPTNDELTRVLVHGILHLLGLDHETSPADAEKMFDLQDKIANELLKK